MLGKALALSRLDAWEPIPGESGTAALYERLGKQEDWPQQVFGEFSHRCRFQMSYYLLHVGFCDTVIFHPFIAGLLSPFSDDELQGGSPGASAMILPPSGKVQYKRKHPDHTTVTPGSM